MASRFSGIRNAFDYAYGVNPDVPALQVVAGQATSGTYSITLAYGFTETVDGQRILVSLTTPITIGNGTTLETVVPTAVSNTTPEQYGTCIVTAAFANGHGIGDQVRSGSGGIVEALNASHTAGGGLVAGDIRVQQAVAASHSAYVTFLGTLKSWVNSTYLDWTGTTGAVSYKPTGGADGGVLVTSTNIIY